MGRTGYSLVYDLPPRSGGGSPHREEPLVGRKRSGPWVRWLLLLRLILLTTTTTATTATTTTTTTIILPTGHPVSSRQRDHLGEGFFPHFVGGIQSAKSLLLSPYPAIPPYVVRTPHPGITDDRGWIIVSRFLQLIKLHQVFQELINLHKVYLNLNKAYQA